MVRNEGLSNDELKDLILESLRGTGVDLALISVRVKNGPKVIVKGDADTAGEKFLIIQTIADVVGIDDIIDNIAVMSPGYDGVAEYDTPGDAIYDEDNECVGTEDVFRALEDGLPYIPPTSSSLDEYDGRSRRRKNRR